MDYIVLLISVFLLVAAIRSHVMTKVYVKTKIDKSWFDRLWTGDRPSVDNLTEEGLRHRKQSNRYAIAGFLMLGLYVLLR
jgi:hypothetical protein